MNKYKFINEGGINWEWLLCYEEVEGGVRIVFHERWHRFSELHSRPDWVQHCFSLAQDVECSRKEGPQRVMTHLVFYDYDVKNERGYNVYTNRRSREVAIIPQTSFYANYAAGLLEVKRCYEDMKKGEANA